MAKYPQCRCLEFMGFGSCVHTREAMAVAMLRETPEDNTAVPYRGTCTLSRDLWWCGNCKRGIGVDTDNTFGLNLDYLAGSWAYCPKCGKKLDWDKALAESK
jgi:hypothetical protein